MLLNSAAAFTKPFPFRDSCFNFEPINPGRKKQNSSAAVQTGNLRNLAFGVLNGDHVVKLVG